MRPKIPLPSSGSRKPAVTPGMTLAQKLAAPKPTLTGTAATPVKHHKSENAHWPGHSGTLTKLTGGFIYLIKMSLEGSTMSGIMTLTHDRLMKQDELDACVEAARAVVNETRIPKRRAEMEANRTPVPDLEEMNRMAFQWDVEFFETAMCDMHGFRRILTMNANSSIEKTAKMALPTT